MSIRILGTGLLAISAGLLAGCETVAERGALAGGGIGAAAGALIGSQSADAGKGALIGGALGTMAGALTGAAIDRAEDRGAARAIAAQRAADAGPDMTVADVVSLSQSGVGEDTIIASIRSSSSTFQLAAADVVHLHNSGVSDRVIQTMMDKKPRYRDERPVVIRHAPPVYVVEPVPVYHFGWHGCWH